MNKKEDHDQPQSLIQQDALKRLEKVEEEKRQPYKKKQEPINLRSIAMTVVLILVIGMMLVGYFAR